MCGLVAVTLFFCFFKINLGIDGKMPKGYKELIQENITIISSSTNILNSEIPHTTTLEIVFTHLKSGFFQDRGVTSLTISWYCLILSRGYALNSQVGIP